MNRFKFANVVFVLTLAAAPSMWPAYGGQAEDAEGIVQQREALAHRQRRIIFNNDGDDAMRATKAGLSDGLTFVTGGDLREDFLRSRTSALANTHVDTISYCTTAIGLTFHHATKVGHFLDKKTFEGCISQDLMEQYGVDTLGVQVEFCRQNGLEIFWSLRMNDRHDSYPAGSRRWTYGLSPFKRDHPKYLFGVPEDWNKYGKESARRWWSGLDFSYPEVREHIFRLIQEVCEGYDIDGVEMDFFRAFPYFPPGLDNQPAGPEHLDMMTGLVRRIRRMADEVGARRGRPILLAPRVPITAELSRFHGLDVEQWLKEGLVDLVIAGLGNGRYRPMSMIGQAVELGHQYNVPVYASVAHYFDHPWQYLHLHGVPRHAWGVPGPRSWPPTGTPQAWRGVAMSAWSAGADGMYTFNVWNPNKQLFREIGDPDVIAGLDKIYGANHFSSISGPPSYRYDDTLTMKLKEGQGVSADLRVGNDVHSKTVSKLWFRVHLTGTTGKEKVTVKLNEVGLSTSVIEDKTGHWHECLLEPSQIRIGVNKVQVMLNKRDPSTQEPILLNGLLLHAGFVDIPPGRRQLFLDDYAVDTMENLTRTLHQPDKKGAVIKPEKRWEKYFVQTRSVPAWDEKSKVFKLWVNASDGDPYTWAGPTYLESKDGLDWTRPSLGQRVYRGSREHNILVIRPQAHWAANAILNVVHTPEDPDPERRYKGFYSRFPRQPIVSPDGIHWKELSVPRIPSGDESNMSYDALTGTYIATLKVGGPFGRSHAVSTSKDFEHWTKPKLLYHADAKDQKRGKARILARLADPTQQDPVYNDPRYYGVDIYNVAVFRYEDLYIILPAMFHTTGPRPEGNTDGFHHVQLACSRNLMSWTRLADRQPFIDTSPVGDAWDTMGMLPPSAPLVRGDELWFYYTASKYRGKPPKLPPNNGADNGADRGADRGAVCLAVLRRDGFMSLDAGEKPGTLLTKPFVLTGAKLLVNVDAADGALDVELLDVAGNTVAVSEPVLGDQPRATVRWKSGDLEALKGKTITVRFKLHNASLYSFWVGAS